MAELAVNGGKPVGQINVVQWPFFNDTDRKYLNDVLESGYWAYLGPYEKKLEKQFADFCRCEYAVSATNGTHTLRIALEALGIGPGDEVIVPAMTWQATASAALDVNAVPILVDIDPETYTISPEKIKGALNKRTKCIIPVHLYSCMCDMDKIKEIADENNLFIIEDCAHQHGSEWRNKRAGTIGEIGSFSLQGSKILNSGEGGLLTTDDSVIHEKMQSLKNCGRALGGSSNAMHSGNYRMTEFQAAIALAQLERLEEQNIIREMTMHKLEKDIRHLTGIKTMHRNPAVTRQAVYQWTLRYNPGEWEGIPRNEFTKALDAELEGSVMINMPYRPLNISPLYNPLNKKTHRLNNEYVKKIDPLQYSMPVAEKAYEEEIINIHHNYLLSEYEDCTKLLYAIEKIRKNIDELKGALND
ncbi:MAG: DegT/DnrJ/EryC1/StrS family aminotransferase [Clostridia bacterium]|nr:DegT/DnrJ/EryC1/StrS family aminotransferase [Clostridia bacterium]